MRNSTDPKWDIMSAACPTRQVLRRIGDKWTMLVISALADEGTLRFSQLSREIEGVTQKMLTQTLRALERDGLVEREVFATVPVTVQYTLTPLGHSLADAVAGIRLWAYGHMDDIEAARERFDSQPAPAGPPTPVATPA
jgi:DNA-binding HxlR family transcriptional regulator